MTVQMYTYVCGKCKSAALYRDDDRLNNIPFLACRICGNRYPGGPAPVKKLPAGNTILPGTDPNRNTIMPESGVLDPATAGIRTDPPRVSNTNKPISHKRGGSIMPRNEQGRLLKVCADCGTLKPHHGRGLCPACYTSRKKAGTLPPRLIAAPEAPGPVAPASSPVIPAKAGIQEMPGPVISVHSPNINLVFPSHDQPLYDAILAEARRNRRDPDQQILWIVNEALCGLMKESA